MSTTGIHDLDHALHEANLWLKELAAKLHTDDPHLAHIALRATLHAVRDRLQPEAAAHLGAQLPTLIRGIYYDGWHIAGKPLHEKHAADFLDHVRKELHDHPKMSAERAVYATFEVLWDRVDAGQVAKIIDVLPADLFDSAPDLKAGRLM